MPRAICDQLSLMANWFREAFGFSEPKDFQSARDAFRVREVASDAVPPAAGPALELEAVATQRVFHVGPFEDISVAQLRARVAEMTATPCLLYTSPSPRDVEESRMPSSA